MTSATCLTTAHDASTINELQESASSQKTNTRIIGAKTFGNQTYPPCLHPWTSLQICKAGVSPFNGLRLALYAIMGVHHWSG